MKVNRLSRYGFLIWVLFISDMGLAGVSPGSEFSFHLFRSIAKLKSTENFVFSPYAIRGALGMAAIGARGKTQKQLGKAPEPWSQKRESSYKLLLANRLWVDMKFPLLDSFMDTSDRTFGVRPWMVDFSKAPDFLSDRINGWVEERTSGKLKEVISEDSISTTSKMILNSAIYFKADWVAPFQRSETSSDKFHSEDGKIQVDYVHRTGSYLYFKGRDFQMIDLPYLDGEIAMAIILPTSSKGLNSIETSIKPENIEHWVGELALKPIDIELPKFEFASALELTDVLKSFGIVDAFDPEKADFSGMTGSKNLYLDRVTHKTSIALTEDGTEASSATASGERGIASEPEKSVKFHANHPFILLIRHRGSNSPLFIGHVVKPTIVVSKPVEQ